MTDRLHYKKIKGIINTKKCITCPLQDLHISEPLRAGRTVTWSVKNMYYNNVCTIMYV